MIEVRCKAWILEELEMIPRRKCHLLLKRLLVVGCVFFFDVEVEAPQKITEEQKLGGNLLRGGTPQCLLFFPLRNIYYIFIYIYIYTQSFQRLFNQRPLLQRRFLVQRRFFDMC